ncbi:L,D-transpeptidase family protein [Sulfuricurvum sp.]|uniref:L,D-transpeptidase family protein n=1 Tax=Sulfuricurvum sp. TaxID=2025608 RepID=UPI003C3BF5EF
MENKRRIQRVPIFLIVLSVLAMAAYPIPSSSIPVSNHSGTSVDAEICRSLQDTEASFQIGPLSETTSAGEELKRFYADIQCHPVWSDDKGVDSRALFVIRAIKQAEEDGLESYDPAYNLEAIVVLMDRISSDPSFKKSPVLLAQLDILLTDAYMMLGKHLYDGIVPHTERSSLWKMAPKKTVDMPLNLRQALRNNTLLESLGRLAPSYPEYKVLKTILVRYLRIQENGGWKTIESASTDPKEIERALGEEIKERLRTEGELAPEDNSIEGYRDALKNFQKRHGIYPDGKVGNTTLSKLNISVEEKILAIRLNLERWRWMPEKREETYIAVNIPDFSLSVVEGNARLMKMRAILGKEERETPIFSAEMRYFVVNPYWHIPSTILWKDILPKVRENIRYLKKERIRIFKQGDESGKKEIKPASINWKKANAAAFPYILRQDPGAKNVLGRLKFIFPNPYDIYIHDTPSKYLFEREERNFSSGCIRIEEPVKLANYLLENASNTGDDTNISDMIARGKNKKIPLSKPMKVYINYWTVFTDDEGRENFRDDVYGYDGELADILGWSPERPTR